MPSTGAQFLQQRYLSSFTDYIWSIIQSLSSNYNSFHSKGGMSTTVYTYEITHKATNPSCCTSLALDWLHKQTTHSSVIVQLTRSLEEMTRGTTATFLRRNQLTRRKNAYYVSVDQLFRSHGRCSKSIPQGYKGGT
jgi:hypothetical protein